MQNIASYISWVLDETPEYYDSSILPQSLIDFARIDRIDSIDLESATDQVTDAMNAGKKQLLSNKSISRWLIREIESRIGTDASFELNVKALERGLFKYRISILSAEAIDLENLDLLVRMLGYRQLVIKIDEFPEVKYDSSIEYETENQYQYSQLVALREWRTIVVHILTNFVAQNVTDILDLANNKFQVVTTGGEPIYVSAIEESKVNILLDLKQYYGWRYVTEDDLILKVMETLEVNPPLRRISGVYIIPFDKKYEDTFRYIVPMVASMIIEGYEAIRLSESILSDNNLLNLYVEVLDRFGHKIVSRPKITDSIITPLVVKSSSSAPKMGSLIGWLLESVESIINNKLPSVVIRCKYPDLSGTIEEQKVVLKYAALLAYSRLIQKYKYLSTSIYDLEVFDDRSIKIRVSKLDEIEDFRRMLSDIIDDYKPRNWALFKASNLRDVVIYRWVLYNDYKAHSMAFQIGLDTYYVVTNKAIESSKMDHSIYFQTLDKYLLQINASIKKSFNPSSLPSDQDLLSFIINYVPIIDMGSNSSSMSLQMINRDQFVRSASSDNLFLNNITGNSISRRSLSRVLMWQYGLAGWFNIGGDIEGYTPNYDIFLWGLEPMAPVRFLTEPGVGQIEIVGKLPSDSYETEFVMVIQAKIDDYHCLSLTSESAQESAQESAKSMYIPLLDLKYHRVDPPDATKISQGEAQLMTEVSSVIAWLWNTGWFLSLWTTAVISSNSKVLTCADVSYSYPLDEVLKTAITSSKAGKRAIRYLNTVIQTL